MMDFQEVGWAWTGLIWLAEDSVKYGELPG